MPKKRLAASESPSWSYALASSAAGAASVTASAKHTSATQASVKLGFITKFPVDFYFTSSSAARRRGRSRTRGSASATRRGSRRPTTPARSPRSRTWSPAGVKGIAITPTSAAVIPALSKAVKSGVKVVLMDNDLPTWKLKSSVVATNNLFKGGTLAGEPGSPTRLKAGATLGILEGVPGVPGPG